MLCSDLSVNNFTMFLVFVTTFIVVYLFTRRPHGIPPGPVCWPFVGNMPSLIGQDVIGVFNNLRQRYGDVYSLYIGSELNVVLNGYDAIHDALVKRGSVFIGRAHQELERNPQIVFADGITWKQNRAFVMRALSDLCLKQKASVLQETITDELNHFTRHLDKMGDVLYLTPHLSKSLLNVMYRLCYGRRVGYDNKELQWFMDHQEKVCNTYVRNELVCKCVPVIKLMPKEWWYTTKDNDTLEKYLRDTSDDTIEGNGKRNALCIAERLKDEDSPVKQDCSWMVIVELLAAAVETTTSTLTWVILFMIKYPDIQQQLHDEIKQVIGMDTPTLDHRPSMPFTEAVILESLRIGSPVPLSVPHRVIQDISFKGYFIPSGTSILPNLVSVHFDPNIFPDPKTFKPGRFLSNDRRTLIATERVIPFSLGNRSCIGETIARTELFLYVTTLMQRYEFRTVEGGTSPSLRGQLGLSYRPRRFEAKLVKRSK